MQRVGPGRVVPVQATPSDRAGSRGSAREHLRARGATNGPRLPCRRRSPPHAGVPGWLPSGHPCGLCDASPGRAEGDDGFVMDEQRCRLARMKAASTLRPHADLLSRGDTAAEFLPDSRIARTGEMSEVRKPADGNLAQPSDGAAAGPRGCSCGCTVTSVKPVPPAPEALRSDALTTSELAADLVIHGRGKPRQ